MMICVIYTQALSINYAVILCTLIYSYIVLNYAYCYKCMQCKHYIYIVQFNTSPYHCCGGVYKVFTEHSHHTQVLCRVDVSDAANVEAEYHANIGRGCVDVAW